MRQNAKFGEIFAKFGGRSEIWEGTQVAALVFAHDASCDGIVACRRPQQMLMRAHALTASAPAVLTAAAPPAAFISGGMPNTGAHARGPPAP